MRGGFSHTPPKDRYGWKGRLDMRSLKNKMSIVGVLFLGGAYIAFYFLNRRIWDGYGTWLYTQLFNLTEPKVKNIVAILIVLLGLTAILRLGELETKFFTGGPVLLIIAGIALRIPIDYMTNAIPLGAAAPIWAVPLQRFCCNLIYSALMVIIALALTKNVKLKQINCKSAFLAVMAAACVVTVLAYTVFVWRVYRVEQFAVDYVAISLEMGDTIRGYAPQDFYEMYRGILTRRLLKGCYLTSFVLSSCGFLSYLKLCKINARTPGQAS